MKKITKGAIILFAATLISAAPTFAQSSGTSGSGSGTATAASNDDRHTNYAPWIGLLGLIGLAGLRRRNDNVHTGTTTTTRAQGA